MATAIAVAVILLVCYYLLIRMIVTHASAAAAVPTGFHADCSGPHHPSRQCRCGACIRGSLIAAVLSISCHLAGDICEQRLGQLLPTVDGTDAAAVSLSGMHSLSCCLEQIL